MALRQHWRPAGGEIPNQPGVYLFRDRQGRVVYVGKAKNLRHRVPSYFTAGLGPRTAALMRDASGVEWIVVGNEIEALQLEVTLIKQHRPRYNVRYRDDKSYPYLAVTVSEEYPRAIVIRGPKKKGNRYFGPFAHAYAIRETLDLLLRVFPIRSCSQGVFDRARRTGRPCLLFDIGRCSAPCVGEVNAGQHRELVERFADFMSGNHAPIVRELEDSMKEASVSLEYEKAARYRDRLIAVQKVIERQVMVTDRREDMDVIGMAGDELESAIQIFLVRGGRVVGRRGFVVDRVEELTEPQLVASFIETFYADQDDLPREVLVPLAPKERGVLEAWLTERRGSKVSIRVPERGAKRGLLQTVAGNAQESFTRSRLKRATDFAARTKALNELQEQLDLTEAPLRIECFDISNLGPTEVVGSMVVFEDALPKKSDYRKFKVRTVEGQDDVASMGEVLRRRLFRLREEREKPSDRSNKFAYQPGLILIDGGKGQLNRVVAVMSELGVVGIPVAALAKRFEEVFLPGEHAPRVVQRGSEALYLLQRLRDEAHRFAVGYQRERSKKRMTQSILDRLPGVGPTRRRALLKHFGSARRIQNATAEQIAEVPGLGKALAHRIYEYLRSHP